MAHCKLVKQLVATLALLWRACWCQSMAVYPRIELLARSVITISVEELWHSPTCNSASFHRGGSGSSTETLSSGVAVPESSSSVERDRMSGLGSALERPVVHGGGMGSELSGMGSELSGIGSEASTGSRHLLRRIYRRIARRVHLRRRRLSTSGAHGAGVDSLGPSALADVLFLPVHEGYVRRQWNTESTQQRHHLQIALQSQRRASQGISMARRNEAQRMEQLRMPQPGMPQPSSIVPLLNNLSLLESMSPAEMEQTWQTDKQPLSTDSSEDKDDTVSTRRRTFRYTLGRARDLYKMLGRFEEFFGAKQPDIGIQLDSTPSHEHTSLLSASSL
ncbi:uncharacterized protein CYBJADRAFT_161075 [Cyberlindnera jadinii NRRL Y-1542]|uniref:Uncharacterized protein n=1 Tax=Cyberlindnera jadinii (strain ATCC 18201 / CBS 1600 / BCRC 20928 / JCM 3617 / NBRC 0987 / NRRL Y-1542) TaxID=983966 RepID=A0A1E4S872_CYBJN|nr:hypothetical protein CYBJADRAFT_161075 [Cyberlindnera jadinii NRRL Y-1542]ODV75678.1 hypothetical protein CYBJADRAFT_161075 [Cyberlindnera jadinii NRRL Y-1542]